MKIETNRLILREWTDNDVDALINGLNNYDTAKNLTVPFPYTEQNARIFINKSKQKADSKHFHFAITLKNTSRVIGGTSLSIKDEKNADNGGIWLHRDYKGKGYGTEVWATMAKVGFDIIGLDKIISGYYEFNKNSEHLHKKVGFKPIGEDMVFCPTLNKEVKEIKVKLSHEDFKSFYNSQNYKFIIIDE